MMTSRVNAELHSNNQSNLCLSIILSSWDANALVFFCVRSNTCTLLDLPFNYFEFRLTRFECWLHHDIFSYVKDVRWLHRELSMYTNWWGGNVIRLCRFRFHFAKNCALWGRTIGWWPKVEGGGFYGVIMKFSRQLNSGKDKGRCE